MPVFCIGGLKNAVLLYRGYLKCHFLYIMSLKCNFVVNGGLEIPFFCIRCLEMLVFFKSGSRKCQSFV